MGGCGRSRHPPSPPLGSGAPPHGQCHLLPVPQSHGMPLVPSPRCPPWGVQASSGAPAPPSALSGKCTPAPSSAPPTPPRPSASPPAEWRLRALPWPFLSCVRLESPCHPQLPTPRPGSAGLSAALGSSVTRLPLQMYRPLHDEGTLGTLEGTLWRKCLPILYRKNVPQGPRSAEQFGNRALWPPVR